MAKTALVIVDVQEDFLPPNGSLAVTNGREVIPVINELSQSGKYDMIITTLDWHPRGHISFASAHNDGKAFTTKHLSDGTEQMLWPDHCIQDSPGSLLAPELDISRVTHQVKKGTLMNKDAYSGFENTDDKSLSDLLKEGNIENVHVVGIATDYCVRATAIDANKIGFKTSIIKEGVRAVFPDKEDEVFDEVVKLGIDVITKDTILN